MCISSKIGGDVLLFRVQKTRESLRIVGNASGTQSTSHQSCSKSSKTFLGCSLI